MFDLAEAWNFLNSSQFVRTLITAMAGAGFGAFTAQRIVARNKEVDDLLKEVRAVNAAATLAFGITDAFINVKLQQVKPLGDKFYEQRTEFLTRVKNRTQGEIIDFHADLQTIEPLKVPLDALQRLIFERISTPTRAISLVGVLDRTVHGLNKHMEQRNDLCNEFRLKGTNPAAFYGFKTERGADERYASTVKAIVSYTDDAIVFSRLLGNDLIAHGNNQKKKLPKKIQRIAPIIVSANFDKASAAIPSAENYRDWETMFVSANDEPTRPGLWERIRRWGR